ncbi:hypothetical protein H696_02533 [Fonticula alba]|uniref:Uncharacterized protein n=1 Tax=Fonticula alba TaxID=691883 RepID=A0A058ZAZ1_FONAL|nr:hypothetical protein H696_02533 [Fonticula alba]KCV71590.1 hypothetical protein H696_02533 [Fonticula alba]|eukprot:XP_009494713.1 hypothetical protein H696_02533 [Fonticula alba]
MNKSHGTQESPKQQKQPQGQQQQQQHIQHPLGQDPAQRTAPAAEGEPRSLKHPGRLPGTAAGKPTSKPAAGRPQAGQSPQASGACRRDQDDPEYCPGLA